MIRLFLNRRSIRKYQVQNVEREKIEKLLTAGLLAPSSRGRKPVELVAIDEKHVLDDLSRSKKNGSEFLAEALFAVVVLGDTRLSDMCIEDCAIAASYIQLEAERLGLGSCWVQIRERQTQGRQSSEAYIRELLNVPEYYMVESVISIGYKAEDKEARSLDDLETEKLHYNTYNMKYPGHFR